MRTALALAMLATAATYYEAEDHVSLPEPLVQIQELVGTWRGVGQPKRGSTVGVWRETVEWAWDFSDDAPALVFSSADAPQFRHGRLTVVTETPRLAWNVEYPSEPRAQYRGQRQPGGAIVLELTNKDERRELPDRVTWRLVAGGDRLVVTLERHIAGEQYARLAEVGYTRQGGNFASGNGLPECIVTGGRATSSLQHEGQTVYVCCSGCREAFLADPDGILAEYATRRAKQKPQSSD